jgi:hypothetical protein
LAQCSAVRPSSKRNHTVFPPTDKTFAMTQSHGVGGVEGIEDGTLASAIAWMLRTATEAKSADTTEVGSAVMGSPNHVDDSLEPIWRTLSDEGRTGMTMLAHHLLETGRLRPDLDLDEVRDVLWNYLAIDTYERLVLTQGWSLHRYTQWLTRAITNAICP